MFGRRRKEKKAPPRQDMRLDWERGRCMLCAGCVPLCGPGALRVTETHLELDWARCNLCGACIRGCPTGALRMETGQLARR